MQQKKSNQEISEIMFVEHLFKLLISLFFLFTFLCLLLVHPIYVNLSHQAVMWIT